MHPCPGNLRAVAEKIERATGLSVEILGGQLVMSPPLCGKHAGTTSRLRQQIEARIPPGLAPYEVSSISMPGDEDDYCTPDLVVLPETWGDDDKWLADPSDVELALEVISMSERAKWTTKNGWYAAAGVRKLLVVDPRYGRWTLFTYPKDAEYHGHLVGAYGDEVPLPQPFGFSLDTSCLPTYGDR